MSTLFRLRYKYGLASRCGLGDFGLVFFELLNGDSVAFYDVSVQVCAGARCSLHSVVVDFYESESLRESLSPLEVVDEGPVHVSPDVESVFYCAVQLVEVPQYVPAPLRVI